MAKKSKKQPYRNALLKLKKERSSLDGLYKENQRLNANLLYRQEEARALLRSAAEDKEKVERLHNAVREELKNVNPYHPDLTLAGIHIASGTFSVEDAMRYRISIPSTNWNDARQEGVVRLTYQEQNGRRETAAYGFSGKLIKNGKSYISDEFIEDLSKSIAIQLTELATTKMKGW